MINNIGEKMITEESKRIKREISEAIWKCGECNGLDLLVPTWKPQVRRDNEQLEYTVEDLNGVVWCNACVKLVSPHTIYKERK